LFWDYVRLWKLTNPKFFLLENVASMSKKDRDIITETFGVEPVLFNASLVSAQCRKRLFWTNIKFDLPDDRNILLKDILQPDAEVDESMIVKGKSFCLTASYYKGGEGQYEYEHNKARHQRTMVKVGHFGKGGQAHRVYDSDGKTPTISSYSPLVLNKRQQANLRSVDEKAHCLTSTNFKGSQANGTTLIKLGHLNEADSQGNRVYSSEGKSATLSANGGGLGAKTPLLLCLES
jgi:DNA (cytosine-5)-methyltransferase 3A